MKTDTTTRGDNMNLAGATLLCIQQPDMAWKQVFLDNDRNPIYFRAEMDDAQIIEALADEGVEVIGLADHFKVH